MHKILLACAAGMSTSMLVEKMKSSAKEQNIEVYIDAMSAGKVKSVYKDFDVVLLGPQVSHLLKEFKDMTESDGIPCEIVNMMDYGMMNGKNVLNRAITLIKGEL